MHVHDIRVSFTREKQPREYEKSAPSIELCASLNDDEDPIAASRELMQTACAAVYNALGMDVPEAIQSKLDAGEVPDGGTAKKDTAKKSTAKKTAAKKTETKKAAADDDLPDDDTGSDEKAKKDTAKKTETKKAAAADDDLPDDGDEKAKKDTAKKTETKKAADDDLPDDDSNSEKSSDSKSEKSSDDDLPDDGDTGSEDAGGDEQMSAEDLQSFITERVSNKKIGVAKVKEILAEHGASRTSDVPADERADVKQKIEDASSS